MKKVELNDFYGFTFLSSLTFSSEGDALAYIATTVDEKENSYRSDLSLLKDGKIIPLTHDGKAGAFFFEDNEHILFDTVRGKDQEKEKNDIFTTLYRLPLNGGEAQKAFELPVGASDFKKLPDGNYLFLGEIRTDTPDLYLLKDEKRKKKLEELKEEEDYEILTESPFFANGQGFVQGKRNALFFYDVKQDKLQRLSDVYMDVQQYEIKEDTVYFIGSRYKTLEPKYNAFYRMDLKTHRVTVLIKKKLSLYDFALFEDKAVFMATEGKRYGDNENPYFYLYDFNTEELSVLNEADESVGMGSLTDVEYGATRFTKKDQNYLYFTALDRDRCRLKRIGLDGAIEIVADLNGSINDFDVSNGKTALMGMFDTDLPEIYLEENGNYLKKTSYNDAYKEDRYIAKPQYIQTVIEGEEIDGWVLLPEEYDEKKKYPAVLDIHGGPKCAYGPIFFHEMQAWASRGYIVMFSNPHGSDGRGNAFAYLDMQWGGIDYKQIMAFVDHVLEAYPAIDEKRLCCTGGSYGGYMSNWILTHTDRFCCIATQRSISNWVTMYGVSDIPPLFSGETCDTDPYSEKGIKEMWDVSPLKYVNNAKTPTLFIHSDEDHRCPIEEGYQLYTALLYKKVPARMVVFHGENHELSRTGKPKHRLKRLQEITNWFDKYTK